MKGSLPACWSKGSVNDECISFLYLVAEVAAADSAPFVNALFVVSGVSFMDKVVCGLGDGVTVDLAGN